MKLHPEEITTILKPGWGNPWFPHALLHAAAVRALLGLRSGEARLRPQLTLSSLPTKPRRSHREATP